MAKTNISSVMEALLTMDIIEIKKGGSYTVISNSGTDEPMKTEGAGNITFTVIPQKFRISLIHFKKPVMA